MRALRVRTAAGVETTAVRRVVDILSVPSVKDTVLDDDLCRKGCEIVLPVECHDLEGKPIKSCWFPAFQSDCKGRFAILSPISAKANDLARVIEEFESGQATPEIMEKMVQSYLRTAVNMLAGKGGLISNHVLSSRISGSGRAVLLINGDHHPQFVGLPDQLMAGLHIEEGDAVLYGRDPSIWHGSLEIGVARRSGNNCIELHPLILPQLGGDCDGDQVYVYALPKDPEVYQEALDHIMGFARVNAQWPHWMSLEDEEDSVIWDKVQEETEKRSETTGFSVSPREILEKDKRLLKLCEQIRKDVSDECCKIAEGLTHEQTLEYILDQNETQLRTKVWLGPIGAASNRLKALAGSNRPLLESACYVSERLQQLLLSSKHVVSTSTQSYSVERVLAMLNRTGPFQKATVTDILNELNKFGIEKDRAGPIIVHMWLLWPLRRAISTLMSGLHDRCIRRALKYTSLIDHKSLGAASGVLDRIVQISHSCKRPLTRAMIVEEYFKNAAGVVDICKAEFPVSEMASGMKSYEDLQRLTIRVLHGERDRDGVGRSMMEMALGEEE